MFAAHLCGFNGDPWFSSVSLLLHGNGSLVDSSANNFTVTAYNGITTTSTDPKYGSGCFNNTAGYLLVASASALNLTSTSFTIELWFKVSGYSSYQSLVMQDDLMSSNQAFQFRLSSTGKVEFIYFTTSSRASAVTLTGTTTISTDTWNHIAVSWDGSNIRIFLNGSVEVTSACSSMYSNTIGTSIGGVNNYYSLVGRFDDVRITKGVCRYTAAFTPPTNEFPDY
jgi:hypothetical protein